MSSVLGNQERMSEVELELQAVVDLPLPSTRSPGAGSQPSLSGGTAHVLTWGHLSSPLKILCKVQINLITDIEQLAHLFW